MSLKTHTASEHTGQQIQNTSIFGASVPDHNNQDSIKNATSDRNNDNNTPVKHKLLAGLQQIIVALDFRNGYDEFKNAFVNMSIHNDDENKHEKHIDQLEHPHEQKITTNNLEAHHQEQQTNLLNQTPFFGSQMKIHKQKSSQINYDSLISFSNAVQNIMAQISSKNKESIQQLEHNFKRFSDIKYLDAYIEQARLLIKNKTDQAGRQLMDNLQRSIQPVKFLHHLQKPQPAPQNKNKNIKPQSPSDDNQFMTEQFSSHHRLQQVSKYVNEIEQYVMQRQLSKNKEIKQHQINQLLKIVELLSAKQNLRNGFETIKTIKMTNQDSHIKNKQQRVGSALVSQRMGSAQSKRLHSAISKNSENQQSFNLDLTVRTKNSKNPYHLGKGDSLMYSMDSGFGFQPESPTRIKKTGDENSNSSRSVLQKYNDVIDETHQKQHNEQHSSSARKPIHKSYSQKIDYNQTEVKPRRLASSKQKIQEFHQQQNQDKSDAHGLSRQITQQNIDVNQYHDNNGNSEQRQNFFKPKYRDYDQDQQNNQQNLQKQEQKHHKHKHQRQLEGTDKSKIQNHQQHKTNGKHSAQIYDQQDNQVNNNGSLLHEQGKQMHDSIQKQNKQKHKQQQKHKSKNEQIHQTKQYISKHKHQKHVVQQKKDYFHAQNNIIQSSSGSPKPESIKKEGQNIGLSLSQVEKSKFRKIKIKQQQNDNSSVKDGTIVDRVQNFDADDQDQETKVRQSADFTKKKGLSKPKKRVQTQVTNQKIAISQHKSNNSSKNIKVFNKVDFSNYDEGSPQSNSQVVVSNCSSRANIFSTEINTYQSKIARLREQKQTKKRNLQKQLAKINYELKVIHQKEQQMSPQNKNGYASRVKISDNNQAQIRAEVLVKNLRSQKRNRNIAKVGEFSNLDKNINVYMEELTKLRAQNQQKLKQKKKIEILQRMKQNQMRKISEKKKIEQNQQFVMHLKVTGDSTGIKNDFSVPEMPSKRTPTKQQQQVHLPAITNPTPEISQKKAYVNRARGYSVKKDRPRDAYEQNLG